MRDRRPETSHLVEYRFAYGRHDGNLYASTGGGGGVVEEGSGGISAQVLPRAVREAACHRFVDVDMECAHQSMLAARFLDCGNRGLEGGGADRCIVPAVLQQYLRDKGAVRGMLAAYYGTSENGAKKLLNMISFGAGTAALTGWRAEFGVGEETFRREHPFVARYRQMMHRAAAELVIDEDVEFAKFKRNPRRSALSEICSRYQAQVLDWASRRLEARWGFPRRTSILMFDGLMVVAASVPEAALNDLHAAGLRELGVWVKWACKSPHCSTKTTEVLELPSSPTHRSTLVDQRAWDPYE